MIDACFVINLDRRQDRLERFCRRYPKEMPAPERWAAVDGNRVVPPKRRPRQFHAGSWGCWESHLAILKHCDEQQINSVLIFEDDALPNENAGSKWLAFMDELPEDWQFVYLGGYLLGRKHAPRKISDSVYIPSGITGTHAYMVRQPFMKRLIVELQQPTYHIHLDRWYADFIPKLNMRGYYASAEWLFSQEGGYSDISHESRGPMHGENPKDARDHLLLPNEQPCLVGDDGECVRAGCHGRDLPVCRVKKGISWKPLPLAGAP